uniref:Mstr1 n=1 Tax=Arundo donax TaxID=35708 RepID=A0A0A8Y980_ARUDO
MMPAGTAARARLKHQHHP